MQAWQAGKSVASPKRRYSPTLLAAFATTVIATAVATAVATVGLPTEPSAAPNMSPPLVGPVFDVIASQGQTSLDYNCDGFIGDLDLLALVAGGSFDINTFLDMLAQWGEPAYDVNCDTIVNRDDLFQVVTESISESQAIVNAYDAQWGETGTPYDLNCDGVVNGLDSMAMVTSGSFDITQYLALLGDWGASPHELDLNCDGIVGIQDFLAALWALSDGEG